MQQDINLYSHLPKKKKSPLTFQVMVLSYAAFIMLLALHFCWELWLKHVENKQNYALNQELVMIQTRLSEIRKQYPLLDSKDIEGSLKKLQEELKEKNEVFNLLARDKHFSNYLLGIAKAAVPDLWLVEIQIRTSKKDFSLKGYALQASAIQQFMNRLGLQKEFTDIHFQLQDVTKTEIKKEPLLSFIISTQVNSENKTRK